MAGCSDFIVLNEPEKLEEFKRIVGDAGMYKDGEVYFLTPKQAKRIYEQATEQGISVDWGFAQSIDEVEKLLGVKAL